MRGAIAAALLASVISAASARANDTWVGLFANGTADLDHATGILHHRWNAQAPYLPVWPAFSPDGNTVFMTEQNGNGGRLAVYDRNHNAQCGAANPPCPSAALPVGVVSV